MQHFDEHLNCNEGKYNFFTLYFSSAGDTSTSREVKDVCQLNHNKGASKDGIETELIEMGPETICLLRVIRTTCKAEQLIE